jgi:hypothetical protein
MVIRPTKKVGITFGCKLSGDSPSMPGAVSDDRLSCQLVIPTLVNESIRQYHRPQRPTYCLSKFHRNKNRPLNPAPRPTRS